MPLLLDRHTETKASTEAAVLDVGLLNNLSDAGLEGGDRQIVDILSEAAGERTVRLRFFSLPSIPRSSTGRAYIDAHYTEFAELQNTKLDGLIVTGCEPRCQRLPDEAFWPQLSDVIDWAEHHTRSTIWSCLAAHAAVLHLDGIERQPLPTKRTGMFQVGLLEAHPLLEGIDGTIRVPHSRWNGLDSDKLSAAGYSILTQGDDTGPDTFIKQWRSLFIYLQGHPEYDGDALRREYRRDVARYLEGSSDTYPTLPSNYFDPATEAKLKSYETCVEGNREPRLLRALPAERQKKLTRRELAPTLFGNWLTLLSDKVSNLEA